MSDSGSNAFPSSAKVVVIGAGIVGNCLVGHLSRLGWTDMVQIDKGPLPNPGGSTGHASNFIFPTDHNKEMAFLTIDSQNQYIDAGLNNTCGGIEVAREPQRLEEFKRRMTSAKAWGIEASLVTPAEIKEMVPFINEDILLGGYYTPSVSVVDSLATGTKMREEAMANGIPVVTLSTPQRKKANAQAELVEHNVTGFVCRWQWQYAGAVIELLQNESLRAAFGRRSYEKAREQFDAALLTKRLEDIYVDLMDMRP